MIVTVNSQVLAQELRDVNKVVASKPTYPVLSHIWVHADQQGLHFYATDLQVGFITSCSAEVQIGGTITLPAKRLLGIIEQLPNADVQLSLEKGHVHLTCGEFKSRLQTLPAADFPKLPHVEGDPIQFGAGVLQEMLSKVSYALADQNSKHNINGALLTQTGALLSLVATDGKRLSLSWMQTPEGPDSRTILPTKALEVLPTVFPNEALEVSRSDKHIFFLSEGRVFFSQMIDGKFPEYKRIIPQNNTKKATIDRVALSAALRRVGTVAEENCATYLSFDVGGVDIKASSAAVGDAAEHVNLQYEGEPVRICVNWQYVLDFLDAAHSHTVTLEGTTSTSPLLLTDGEFINVIMTMRP